LTKELNNIVYGIGSVRTQNVGHYVMSNVLQ